MASVSTTLARKPTIPIELTKEVRSLLDKNPQAFSQSLLYKTSTGEKIKDTERRVSEFRARQPERLVRHRSRPARSQRRRRRRRRDAGDPGLAVGGHARGGQTRSEEAPERTCRLPGSVE